MHLFLNRNLFLRGDKNTRLSLLLVKRCKANEQIPASGLQVGLKKTTNAPNVRGRNSRENTEAAEKAAARVCNTVSHKTIGSEFTTASNHSLTRSLNPVLKRNKDCYLPTHHFLLPEAFFLYIYKYSLLATKVPADWVSNKRVSLKRIHSAPSKALGAGTRQLASERAHSKALTSYESYVFFQKFRYKV